MGYFNQFKTFHPLSGEFNSWKFPSRNYLSWKFSDGPSIIYRARSILRGRTIEEILCIAEDANQIIEAFFDREKENAIDMIQDEGRLELLELEDGRAVGLSDNAYEHYDIRTSENTSDLEALQEGIDDFYDPSYLQLTNARQNEYFAVLSLWRVADCIQRIQTVFDLNQMKRIERTDQPLDVNDAIEAGACLVEAMESVCYAERLRQVEITQAMYEEELNKLRAQPRVMSDEEIARQREDIARQIEADAKAKRIEQSKENNRRRHLENNEIKAGVLSLWEQNPRQFGSAEKAGAYYVDVLLKRGIEREHRTVVGWIRTRAKELNIRFR